jgi:hypothetical protein
VGVIGASKIGKCVIVGRREEEGRKNRQEGVGKTRVRGRMISWEMENGEEDDGKRVFEWTERDKSKVKVRKVGNGKNGVHREKERKLGNINEEGAEEMGC